MVLFYSQNRTGHTDEIRKYKEYPNKYLITVVFVTLSKNAMYNFSIYFHFDGFGRFRVTLKLCTSFLDY